MSDRPTGFGAFAQRGGEAPHFKIRAGKSVRTGGPHFKIESMAHLSDHERHRLDAAQSPTLHDDPLVLAAGQTVTLPVIEETLEVRKVAVDRGGYRIDKRVEVHEQLVDELLRHERVEIERRPVGRALAAGEAPEARYEGDTLVLPVIEEVLVTETRWMLVEEVRITRTQGTHTDSRRIELRKEQIDIERLGADIPVIRSSSLPDSGDLNDHTVKE